MLVLLPTWTRQAFSAIAWPIHCDWKNYPSIMHNRHGGQGKVEATVPCEHVETMAHTPAASMSAVSVIEEEGKDEDGEIVTLTSRDAGQTVVGCFLDDQQKADLTRLLEDKQDIFNNKLGRTNTIQHAVDTSDTAPFWLPPYRIPKA